MNLSSRARAAIPAPLKRELRARAYQVKRAWVSAFRSYDPAQLVAVLRELGVREGDTALLHSGFMAEHGFRGSIEQLTNAFLEAVGASGNLMMVSLPYRTSSLDYLNRLKVFDVRKTPSMMGLVSEYFRRRAGVLRSLHPTHPMLVLGANARELVAGHEDCLYPCGPGTPFEKLAQADGQCLFFNVPFAVFTFFHHLEHLVAHELPFSLYTEAPHVVPVVDAQGASRTVTTVVFSNEAIRRRRFEMFEQAMRERGAIRTRHIGASTVLAVRVRDAIDCVRDMARNGQYFYDLTPSAAA
jgi:aminoglycoside 3-N-acetyltransferase